MVNDSPKVPSPFISLIPLLVLVCLLFFTISIWGGDALNGASQIVLLCSTAVCCLISMSFYKVRWKHLEASIVNNITGVGLALIILLIIGALSSSWMISGVVPTLIYYGVQLIHPSLFLVSTCIICAIVSVVTGSSWTTVATIGVALFGIGKVQGFDEGWIAGAIISGAYFGDKVSPLSDTTILASSVSGTPLFKHIRYLMITTVPSFTIALIIFAISGFNHQATDMTHIVEFRNTLNTTFTISLWLLLVPVATGFMIAKRVPAVITLFVSSILAIIFAVFFQSDLLRQIAGAEFADVKSLFTGSLMSLYGGTQIETGNAAINDLVATRGMRGMMNTVWLILCAMCFGGVMVASSMLNSIISLFFRFMKNTFGLVTSTVFSGLFFNLCTADQYISIILTGKMFKDIYRQKGYDSCLLSRTTEDSVTVTSPLVPWNSCGLTQSAVLGVATLTYLPYCFFNLISPLMSIIVSALGYKIARISPNPTNPSDSAHEFIDKNYTD
ncbi:MAG: Na+/H+ antiporter NhaC [Massilibacteroides sp.]|nr:Na+/H+ antiporter NhaC [Massilibacteroides sp.]